MRQFFGFVETANLLFLKLLLKKPSNLRLFPGKIFREYMALAEDDKWPCRNIFKIFPNMENCRVTLEVLPGKGVSTPPDELVYLAVLTKVLEAKTVFEIGTYRGRTALNFALNVPSDGRVFTLDLHPDSDETSSGQVSAADAALIRTSLPGANFKGKDMEYKIKQLYGDSTKFDFSSYYESIDLVFVDGAHHYDAVKSDTLNALKMIKPGGIIIWDDFANYGDYNDVTRAVLDCMGKERIVQIAGTQLALHISTPER